MSVWTNVCRTSAVCGWRLGGALLVTTALVAGHAATAETIKLGVLAPISGPGAQIGESGQVGVEFAVKRINEEGGIDGRQIELIVGDTQANPTAGVSEAKRLIEQGSVDLVVGPTYSQVSLAVQPMLIDAEIPSINVSGTELLTPEAAPHSFSMLVNARSQAQAIVGYAADTLNARSVAILSDSGAQAKTAVAAMQEELAARGITVTATQEYQYGAPDMTPQLLDLRSGEADALLLFTSTGDDTGNVLKGLQEIGWEVPVSGSYGVALSAPAINIAGAEAFENVAGINYAAWTYCPGENLSAEITKFIEGVKAFRPDAADRLPHNYVSLWYDGVYLLKAAVEGTGGKTDGPTVAAWIEENSGSFDGINSDLAASADNHFLIGLDNLAMVHPERMEEGGVQERVDCD